MTYQEFNMCRREYTIDWKKKWSELNVDFETFMIMYKGLTQLQYDSLNKYKPNIPSPSHDSYDLFHPHEEG